MKETAEVVEVPIVDATLENTKDYGLFIGTDVPNAGLTIPFYKGAVEEGHNIPFACSGQQEACPTTWQPVWPDEPIGKSN